MDNALLAANETSLGPPHKSAAVKSKEKKKKKNLMVWKKLNIDFLVIYFGLNYMFWVIFWKKLNGLKKVELFASWLCNQRTNRFNRIWKAFHFYNSLVMPNLSSHCWFLCISALFIWSCIIRYFMHKLAMNNRSC